MELQRNAAHRVGKRSKFDVADSEGYGGSGRLQLTNVEASYWIFGFDHKLVTNKLVSNATEEDRWTDPCGRALLERQARQGSN